MREPIASGWCAPRFTAVPEAFAARQRDGREPAGAAVAVTIGGEPVVGIWNYSELAGARPWQTDTLACIYSATKALLLDPRAGAHRGVYASGGTS